MDHIEYKCQCSRERHCYFCDGDLFMCTVCTGAEGSLPTERPGRQMTAEEADAVYAGKLDFINRAWVVKDPQS